MTAIFFRFCGRFYEQYQLRYRSFTCQTSNIDVFFVTSFLCSLKFVLFHLIGHTKRCLQKNIENVLWLSVCDMTVPSTRGLSAWQLRCLIVYATLMMSNCLWYTAKLIPNDLDLTFQCHPRSNVMGVNWKTIYDLLYVFHAKFDKKMPHLGDATFWKSCDLDLTLKGYPMSIVLR